jgi:hypothetical protein
VVTKEVWWFRRLTPRNVTVAERKRKKKQLRQDHVDFDEWRFRENEEERSE